MIRFFFFLLVYLPTTLVAQEVFLSEEIFLKNDKAYFLVGKFDDNFVLFRDIDHKYRMHVYDSKMLPVEDFEFSFDLKNMDIIDVIRDNNDNFNIIYSAKTKGQFCIKVEKYNIKAELIDSTRLYQKERTFDDPEYEIVLSENERHVLLYNVQSKNKLSAIVFDNINLDLKWQQNFEEESLDLHYGLIETLVSNEGELYLISEKRTGLNNKQRPKFTFHNYKEGYEKMDTFSVDLQEKRNYYVNFKIDNLNSRITAGGLYSNKSLFKASGFYFLSFPIVNPKDYIFRHHEFTEEYVKEYLQKKSVRKKAGFVDAKIQDIILRKDGGILMLGEKIQKKDRITSSRSSEDTYRADYFYEEIFLISIHPSGKEHWKNIIHKKQYSFDDQAIFSSFFPATSRSSLKLIFNDEIRSQSTVSEFTLKADGKYKRQAILNTRDMTIKLRIKDAMQVSSSEIIVPSQYKNRLRLVKFKY